MLGSHHPDLISSKPDTNMSARLKKARQRVSEPEEIQVPVQFIRDDEFEAKDWPEYDVPISPECSEEDFQKEFCDVINELENVLLIEGWTVSYTHLTLPTKRIV